MVTVLTAILLLNFVYSAGPYNVLKMVHPRPSQTIPTPSPHYLTGSAVPVISPICETGDTDLQHAVSSAAASSFAQHLDEGCVVHQEAPLHASMPQHRTESTKQQASHNTGQKSPNSRKTWYTATHTNGMRVFLWTRHTCMCCNVL